MKRLFGLLLALALLLPLCLSHGAVSGANSQDVLLPAKRIARWICQIIITARRLRIRSQTSRRLHPGRTRTNFSGLLPLSLPTSRGSPGRRIPPPLICISFQSHAYRQPAPRCSRAPLSRAHSLRVPKDQLNVRFKNVAFPDHCLGGTCHCRGFRRLDAGNNKPTQPLPLRRITGGRIRPGHADASSTGRPALHDHQGQLNQRRGALVCL